MMGTSTYGHSFVVVGPDGNIRRQADYGGSPDPRCTCPSMSSLDDLRRRRVVVVSVAVTLLTRQDRNLYDRAKAVLANVVVP